MPQIVKKRRSGWAILAVGALIASFLAVGAAPAAAIDEDSEQDQKASATACLGIAVDDAGFTDLGSLEAAVADINCLAYYGVTTGKTADTFDPDTNVTRGQMALFLSRAATVMGVDLSEGDMGADFGDIAELGQGRQDAITSLARNGIMGGRGDMAFDPHGDITRAEMAVAIVNLLDQTPGAPVHKNKAGLFVLGEDAQTAGLPNDTFGDAYAEVSQPLNNAISAAYELGITTGRPAGSDDFAPNKGVPRRNMATFITRALGHSNARPSGLTAQVAGGTITVSVRDANFAPVVNQAVDAFKTAAAFEAKAFKDDGTCSSRTTLVDGATKCEVDGADAVTDSRGNANLAQLDAAGIGKGLTVWLWAGDVGDKVGTDTDLYEMSVVPEDTSAPTASSSTIKTDVAEGAGKVHFSTTVTVTVQLQGGTPLEDAGPGDIGGDDGVTYSVVINKRATSDASDPDPNDTVFDTKTIDVKADDDGAATFTVEANDTSPDTTGNRVMVSWTVTGSDLQPDPDTDDVIFSDETPVVTVITVAAAPFQNAPGESNRSGTATTVTVVDQFARPFKGAGIVLTSNNGDSVLPTRARITGSNGQVRIGYSYTGAASAESLTATWHSDDTRDASDAKILAIDCEGVDVCGTTTAYWVSAYVDIAGVITVAAVVLAADLDDNQIIYNPDSPTSVNYDSGDYFTVDGAPASYETFEEALGKGVTARAEALAAAAAAPTPFTIEFSSYVYDDPSDIAQFTLVTE